jgi:hypothetical protein
MRMTAYLSTTFTSCYDISGAELSTMHRHDSQDLVANMVTGKSRPFIVST